MARLVSEVFFSAATLGFGFFLGWTGRGRENLDEAEERLERRLRRRQADGIAARRLLRPHPSNRQLVIKPTGRDRNEVNNLED